MYIIDARLLLRKDYSMPIKLDIGRWFRDMSLSMQIARGTFMIETTTTTTIKKEIW